MDPVTIAVISVAGAIAISAAAAAIFWPKVIKWAEGNLLPWVQEHAPYLEQVAREAFTVVDRIATPAYAIIKEKWQEIRKYLLRQVEKFEQQTDHTWLLETTSWFRETLEGDPEKTVVEEIRTVRQVSFEDLPAEVREAALRRGATTYEIDFTRERDAELGLELSA